jgi:hypothetical protein
MSSLPKLIVVPLAHELAVPLADLGGAEVAAEVGDEALDEPQVLEAGDEQQSAVERDRAAEEPLARLGVGEQAVAQALGVEPGHLDLDGVDRIGGALGIVEGQHRLLAEAGADAIGDVAQLLRGDAVDVELPRALEGRRAEVGGEEDAVEQLRDARLAAAALDDAIDLALEAAQRVVEPRVGGVGDDRGVVGGEELGVGQAAAVGGGAAGRGGSDGGGDGRARARRCMEREILLLERKPLRGRAVPGAADNL